MRKRKNSSGIPIRYDDGFRAGIASVISTIVGAGVMALSLRVSQNSLLVSLFVALCVMLAGYFLIFLVWTQRLWARTPRDEAARIAAAQFRRGPGPVARMFGFARAEDWAVSSAASALVVAIVAAVIGADAGSLWLPALVFLTAGSAWAVMVFAYGLRYFRMHCAGETIEFDITEEPEFEDFISMAVMITAVGALPAGTPRTRVGLRTVRTHTYIAFGFNALVVAMTVSIVAGFITSAR